MVASGVEFSFEDVRYRQVDGVAMGSPLGPVLANIFVGYCETLIPEGKLPPLYCRYVDDSFSCFASKSDSFVFLDVLNNLQPSLKFTCEFEECGRLPFLDVLVEKSVEGGVLTTVYRKPTFTGLYIVWGPFVPSRIKLILFVIWWIVLIEFALNLYWKLSWMYCVVCSVSMVIRSML